VNNNGLKFHENWKTPYTPESAPITNMNRDKYKSMTEKRPGEYINRPFILEGQAAIDFDEYNKNPTITLEGLKMIKEGIKIGKRLISQKK